MKKPEKKTIPNSQEYPLVYIANLNYNQACDEWEAYVKQLIHDHEILVDTIFSKRSEKMTDKESQMNLIDGIEKVLKQYCNFCKAPYNNRDLATAIRKELLRRLPREKGGRVGEMIAIPSDVDVKDGVVFIKGFNQAITDIKKAIER